MQANHRREEVSGGEEEKRQRVIFLSMWPLLFILIWQAQSQWKDTKTAPSYQDYEEHEILFLYPLGSVRTYARTHTHTHTHTHY